MFRSIRWNFLGWLLVTQVLGLGSFGGALYYLVRHSQLEKVDVELVGAAELLAEKLRRPRPPRKSGPPRSLGSRGPGSKSRELAPDANRDELEASRGEGAPMSSEPGTDATEKPAPYPQARDSRFPGRGGREPGEGAETIELPAGFLERFEASGGSFFAIWRADGSVAKELRLPPGVERPALPEGGRERQFRDREHYREIVQVAPRGAVVLVGQSIDAQLLELRRLAGYLFGAGGAVLAIGLLGAWFIAKRTIRPIEAIASTAEAISAEHLTQRIDIESTTNELGKLARVLNTTFDRLQRAFDRQARFTADASHELRTPLAVILAQTTLARRKDRSASEYREVVDACHTAARRMKSLVDGLLTLARTDAGDLQLDRSEVDLAQVVEECLGLLQPLTEQRGLRFERELEGVRVDGDAGRLAQVVTNLVTNAIHYNRPGGSVRTTLRTDRGWAVLAVADTGVGISPEHLPRVFDRFFRADAARSRTDGGSGLGLAIAKAITEAHGGSISCESALDRGTVFTVRLPIHAAAESPTPGPAGTSPAPSSPEPAGTAPRGT